MIDFTIQKKPAVLMFLVCICTAIICQPALAQFDLKALKDKVVEQIPASNTITESSSSGLTPLAYNRKFPPSVIHESLLYHMEFEPDGTFELSHVSVAFLPTHDEKGNEVDYNEPARLHVRLLHGSNELFDMYYTPQWSGNKLFTKFEYSRNEEKNINKDFEGPLVAGSYQLMFYLDDKLFSKVPFQVVQPDLDDPYAEEEPLRFIEGMWNNYGYLKWQDKKDVDSGDHAKLYWNVYKQHVSAEEESSDVNFYSEIYQDGKYLATTGKFDRYEDLNMETFENNWENMKKLFFMVPKDKGPDTDKILKKNHLKDGNYVIKTYTGEKLDTFKFVVQDGKIQPNGKQVRSGTKPEEFIEGINKTWWLKSQ